MTTIYRTLETASLDPALAGLLAHMASQGNPPLEALPPHVGRQIYRDMDAALGSPAPAIGKVEDLSMPGPASALALRIYTPATAGPWPVLLFIHGGGFVIGDLDTHDRVCRSLCHHAHMLVVAVDYRLAPEHPFPAAPDDAEAALRWVCANATALGGDASRIAVAGDSAGAQLALVAARRVGGAQLRAVGMVYPVAQHPDAPSLSYAENGAGKFLTLDAMRWFTASYLGGQPAAAKHPDFDLLHSDVAGLPATWIATMGHDPLRDEGYALALRMEQAGVAVAHAHYPGAIHACIHFSAVAQVGSQIVADLARWLRETV